MDFIIIVKAISTKQSYDGLIFHLRFGQISEINARRIALELHVESELIPLYIGCKIVYVLHHQSPVALTRVVAGILQSFYNKRRVDIGIV